MVEGGLGLDAGQRAFQLADVAVDAAGDEIEHVVGDFQIVRQRLLLKDGDARLQIRRLDVGDEAPLEARTKTILQALDVPGMTVGGKDDGLVGVVQGIEGVEEFFLGPFLCI